MAIEIRELIITATIEGEGKKQQGKKDAEASDDRDRLVQECVDQVVRILKEEDRR